MSSRLQFFCFMPCNPFPNSSPQDRVTFLDGGPALLHMTSKLLPGSNIQRCYFHLDRNLVKKREPVTTRDTYRHRPPLLGHCFHMQAGTLMAT